MKQLSSNERVKFNAIKFNFSQLYENSHNADLVADNIRFFFYLFSVSRHSRKQTRLIEVH